MKRIIQVLSLVVLVGILAEAGSRLSGGRVSGIVHDPVLGWRFLKNYHPRGGTSFNSLGFRDGEHAVEKREGVTRILLLGDSATAGTHVADNRTFRALIEAHLGKNFEVMAGAVSAWATDQELLYLKEEGLKFRPDVVVLMFAPNDVRESYAKRFFRLEGGRLVQNAPLALKLKERAAWYLLNHSTLFHSYQVKFAPQWETFQIIFRNFPVSFPLASGAKATDQDLFRREMPADLEEAWSLSLALVDEVRRLSVESGARFSLAVIPTKIEFEGSLSPERHEPGKIARRFSAYALEQEMSYLNLYARLAATEDPLRIFLKDEYHFNDVGHAWVASQLEGFLQTELSAARRVSALPSRH